MWRWVIYAFWMEVFELLKHQELRYRIINNPWKFTWKIFWRAFIKALFRR